MPWPARCTPSSINSRFRSRRRPSRNTRRRRVRPRSRTRRRRWCRSSARRRSVGRLDERAERFVRQFRHHRAHSMLNRASRRHHVLLLHRPAAFAEERDRHRRRLVTRIREQDIGLCDSRTANAAFGERPFRVGRRVAEAVVGLVPVRGHPGQYIDRSETIGSDDSMRVATAALASEGSSSATLIVVRVRARQHLVASPARRSPGDRSTSPAPPDRSDWPAAGTS